MSFPAFAQSNLLAGSWQLTAANKILPDGSEVADYGESPRGVAIFTADGHYIPEIFRPDHMKFASGDRSKGTPDEYRSTVTGASCSFGAYTVGEVKGAITFRVVRSAFPNWDETTRTAGFILPCNMLKWKSAARQDGAPPVTILSRMQV